MRAVAADLESTDGVSDAQVILRGTARSPEPLIHVDTDERADLDTVIAEVAERAAGNASVTLGAPLSAVALEVGVARTRSRRQPSVSVQVVGRAASAGQKCICADLDQRTRIHTSDPLVQSSRRRLRRTAVNDKNPGARNRDIPGSSQHSPRVPGRIPIRPLCSPDPHRANTII